MTRPEPRRKIAADLIHVRGMLQPIIAEMKQKQTYIDHELAASREPASGFVDPSQKKAHYERFRVQRPPMTADDWRRISDDLDFVIRALADTAQIARSQIERSEAQ